MYCIFTVYYLLILTCNYKYRTYAQKYPWVPYKSTHEYHTEVPGSTIQTYPGVPYKSTQKYHTKVLRITIQKYPGVPYKSSTIQKYPGVPYKITRSTIQKYPGVLYKSTREYHTYVLGVSYNYPKIPHKSTPEYHTKYPIVPYDIYFWYFRFFKKNTKVLLWYRCGTFSLVCSSMAPCETWSETWRDIFSIDLLKEDL